MHAEITGKKKCFTTIEAKNAGAYKSIDDWQKYVSEQAMMGLTPCPNAIEKAKRTFGEMQQSVTTSKAA